MSYLDRLKGQFPENCPTEVLPKLPKARRAPTYATAKTAKSPYDSFGSAQGRHFLETEAALWAGVATHRNLGSDGTPLPPAAEARRRKVLALLARDGKQYAVCVEDPNTDPVVMALATPEGTCEVLIPKDRYDPFAVLAIVKGWEREDVDTSSSPEAERNGVGQKSDPPSSAPETPPTSSLPYREKAGDEVGVTDFPPPADHLVNEGQRGSNEVDEVDEVRAEDRETGRL